MKTLVKVHFIVLGRVQGVGFRYHTKTQADRLGVVGTVRNCDDGSVEVVAEGEELAIEQFVTWCKTGPSSARVTGVQITLREKVEGATLIGFKIIH